MSPSPEWEEYLRNVGDLGDTEFDILDGEECIHVRLRDYGDGVDRCEECGTVVMTGTEREE